MRRLPRQLKGIIQRHKLLAFPVVALIVVAGYSLITQAATFVAVPNGTIGSGSWAVTGAATHHAAISEGATANESNYVQASSSTTVSTLNLDTTSPTNVASATSLRLYINSRIVGSAGSPANTITGRVMINATQVSTVTITPSTAGYTWQSATAVSGSWSQSDLDSMRIELTRDERTSGNPNSRRDDVRIASVYVDVTYTQNVQVSQASYRWYGNSVQLMDDDSFAKVATLSDSYSGQGIAWSPDGTYLTIASSRISNNMAIVYKRSGDSFTKLIDLTDGIAGHDTAWSPDGQYMSVAHATSPYITIYKRSGDTFTKLADPSSLPTSTGLGTAWSPDGQYMTVAHDSSPYITIYKRSGDTFTKLANPSSLPTNVGLGTAWSPDGQYMTVAHDSSPYITIYKRSGDTFTKLADPSSLPAGAGNDTAWSPDGQYMSVAHVTSPYITIYKRSGDTFTKLADPSSLPAAAGDGTAWSPDGQYMAVGHSFPPYITIYKRSGDTFTKLADPSSLPAAAGEGVAWSPDGAYLALSISNSGFEPIANIYKHNRTVDVSSPLASRDTAATAPAPGQPFRLRLNLGISSGELAGGDYKLRYYHTTVTCSSTATYSDVTTSTPIKFYDNSTVSDKIGLTTNANDPTRSGRTAVRQTYNETNPFSVATTIPAGQDGIWDFALTFDESAETTGSYCIKATTNTGQDLNSYSVIPQISAPVPSYSQSSYRFYENADSLTPGAPLAAQNAAATIAPNGQFRLRQTMRADGSNLAINQKLRLQYAKKVSTCSAASPYNYLVSAAVLSGYSSPSYQDDLMENANMIWNMYGEQLEAYFVVPVYGEDTSTVLTQKYGFDIPLDHTIKSIDFDINMYAEDIGGSSQIEVQLVKNGIPVGAYHRMSIYDNQYTDFTLSIPYSEFGTSFTPEDINGIGFGLAIKILNVESSYLSNVLISYARISVLHEGSAGDFSYYNNSSVSSGAAITATGQDPTDGARPTVLQGYLETDPFQAANVVAPGQNALWDFSLADNGAAEGTYCFRIVTADGSPLDNYLQYPEITIGSSGSSGPTLDQRLRGGQSVIDGVKSPLGWD